LTSEAIVSSGKATTRMFKQLLQFEDRTILSPSSFGWSPEPSQVPIWLISTFPSSQINLIYKPF
jgi:hypothetical protein